MNEAAFNRIAFNISKNSNTTDLDRLQLLTAVWNKNIYLLVSLANKTNTIIDIDDYITLIQEAYTHDIVNRDYQNHFIAAWLRKAGITVTEKQIDKYNENVRAALMREASYYCDNNYDE